MLGRLGGLACVFALGTLSGCDVTSQDRVRLYNEDGVHQFSQGNFRQACDSFEQAVSLKHDDPVLQFNLGQAYERAGETRKAEACYEDCLRRDKNLAEARHAYANLLMRTGRGEQANQLIANWTSKDDAKTDSLILQAWKLRQDKAYPQAYDKLQAALAIEPHNPRALTELGVLYEKMNLPDRSLVLYERVLEGNPNLYEVRERVEQLKARGVTRALPGS